MPTLSQRTVPRSSVRPLPSDHTTPKSPFYGNESMGSPEGNPAPNRGLFPPEFTYDFSTNRFYPDGPQFVRGSVDIITPIRNLALQAAAAAGIKIK